MRTLSQRIIELEKQIKFLYGKIKALTYNTETVRKKPETKIGQTNLGQIAPVTIETGLGAIRGNSPAWNDSELKRPPYGTQPDEPTKGYNNHGHDRYSGGALDIHTLELVEYENIDGVILDPQGNPLNKSCQGFWKNKPNIAKEGTIEKIGNLDIEFDSSSKKWIAGAGNIDVENTYLIQYVWMKGGSEVPPGTEGAVKEIKKDSKGNEMKAPLLYTKGTDEENLDKSNVWWDENAQCWRFYAVFKPCIEEE